MPTVRPLAAAAVAAIGIDAGAVYRVFAAGLLIATVGLAAVSLQCVPFSVNAAGCGFADVNVPLKPVLTLAPVPRVPFQAALVTVTWAPLWAYVPFQPWVTRWPTDVDRTEPSR